MLHTERVTDCFCFVDLQLSNMTEEETGQAVQAVKKRKRTGSEREARKKALIEVGESRGTCDSP